MAELKDLPEIVDKWNEYILVFAFIGIIERSETNKISYIGIQTFIPTTVKFLCLSYFSSYIYTNEDCFDHDKALDIFEISETKLTITNTEGSSWDEHTIFGKQIISSDSGDIFRWAFNIRCDDLIIGICSTKNNKINEDFTHSSSPSVLNRSQSGTFHDQYYAIDNVGNAYTHCQQTIQNQFNWEFGDGDNIQLILHMEYGRLIIQVNGDEMIAVFGNMERAERLNYHLAIQMPEKGDYIELMYSQFVDPILPSSISDTEQYEDEQ